MAKEPYVDQDVCISCGLCITNVPDVFDWDDNGKAKVTDAEGASEDEIQSGAIDVCPVSCIGWR